VSKRVGTGREVTGRDGTGRIGSGRDRRGRGGSEREGTGQNGSEMGGSAFLQSTLLLTFVTDPSESYLLRYKAVHSNEKQSTFRINWTGWHRIQKIEILTIRDLKGS
jgi:hypothetical protein